MMKGMRLSKDDDENNEIVDQLDEKIEIAYEHGDWMLVDHLERVKRNFICNMRRANRDE